MRERDDERPVREVGRSGNEKRGREKDRRPRRTDDERDERGTGGGDVQKETTEGDEENAMGERERTVGHARVVGEEVREMSNSFFHFLSLSSGRIQQNMPMKKKYAPSQSEMNTMATRDLVT